MTSLGQSDANKILNRTCTGGQLDFLPSPEEKQSLYPNDPAKYGRLMEKYEAGAVSGAQPNQSTDT